jgi:hypothetical protein
VIIFLFYLQSIRPLQRTETQIKTNEEIVNTVQASAIDLVDLADELNRLTLAHVGEVTDFIVQYQQIAEETLPSVQQVAKLLKIPGADKIGKLVNNKYVLQEKALLASILLTADKTKEILENVKDALSQSEMEPLKVYQGQVKELSQNVRELLKEVNNSKLRDQFDERPRGKWTKYSKLL